MDSVKNFFTQEHLNKLNLIKLNTSKNLTGGFSGNRRSKAKGQSLEFSDFRAYAFGDDVRRLDWNSYGRLDKLFIKVFEEERQVNLNIFLDISPSMDFGEKNKLFHTKIMAADLAYIALSAADSVNIFTIGKKLSLDIKNPGNKNTFGKILDFLEDLQPSPGSFGIEALEEVGKFIIRPGIAVIFSDFFTDNYQEVILKLLQKKQRLWVVHVMAKEEREPDFYGGIRLVDSETGGFIDMEIDEVIIDEYKKCLAGLVAQLGTFCRARGAEYLQTSSDEASYRVISKIAQK